LPDLLEELHSSLGSTFAFERELGGGGMARLFVAEETALGRKVVVKVLPPEWAAPTAFERFPTRDSRRGRLQHPHIVPVISAGIANGLIYYTTPFVPGEGLRQRLARERQLSIDDAVRFTCEIAEALDHAHHEGVIHRDVKPDNVLLSGGHALLMDFGIAKAVESARDQGLTGTGVSLGTPLYMAPEQTAGAPDVDARADVYSLGCLLFELLTGQPAFFRTLRAGDRGAAFYRAVPTRGV
jgi:serine/threonine-protein kinase